MMKHQQGRLSKDALCTIGKSGEVPSEEWVPGKKEWIIVLEASVKKRNIKNRNWAWKVDWREGWGRGRECQD